MLAEVGTRFAPLNSGTEIQTKSFEPQALKLLSEVKEVEKNPAPVQENAEKKSNNTNIEKILDEINANMYSYDKELRFKINKTTKDVVIQVVNGRTGEVLKQIPTEDILRMRENLLAGQTLGLNLETKIN